MRTRIVVGLIYFALWTIPTILGGLWALAFFLFMGAVSGYEFFRMVDKGGYQPATWLGLTWLLALIFSGARPDLLPQSTVLATGLIVTFIFSLFRLENPFTMVMSTAIGSLYLGVMIGQVAALRMLSDGMWWVFLGLFVTLANDTFAYFVGVTIGRHRIWPRLSPKKTWEGTISGWIGAAVVGGIFATFGLLPISVAGGVLAGLCAGVLGFFGDLSISMIKRQVGVKDTGTIFPGHGGMLDRIDSVLFVLPFIYQVVILFGLAS